MKNKPPYVIKRFFNFFDEISLDYGDKKLQENYHKELNKEFWENYKLKKSIRIAMLKIAKEFNDYLKLGLIVKDIIFTGSLANYNWTSSSDVDIHLILDMSPLSDMEDFVLEYIDAKKTLWNDIHNIKIKGFEVELFAKDEETMVTSKGIYSIIKNNWIQKPSPNTSPIDDVDVKEKASSIMKSIESLDKIKDDKERFEKSDKIKDKIKKIRKSGLEKNGEYSIENLVFKTLRRNGYMDKLFKIKNKSFDSYLSLPEENVAMINESNVTKRKMLLKEDKENAIKKLGCLMIDFPIKNWNKITGIIKKKDIYNKPDFGISENPHITVLFGFIPNKTNPKDVEKFVKEVLINKENVEIKLIGISLFQNKDYDVLKFDVESPDLVYLNKKIKSEFEYKSDYPNYTPHMTISYLNKGTGQKYVKDLKKPITFESSKFTYSYPPNEKIKFDLKSKHNILGVEKNIKGMTEEKIEIIKQFINFVCNRLEIKESVEIYLHKGRDEYIITTASYIPAENSNHVRCEGRSIVDILRSIAHEMVHNRQREVGSYKNGEQVQTIGGWIEDEANAKAGILIKDFAMNYGFDSIYDI